MRGESVNKPGTQYRLVSIIKCTLLLCLCLWLQMVDRILCYIYIYIYIMAGNVQRMGS